MPSNESAPVKLSLPLEYQREIFNELRSEDELLIIARGVGLLRIITNLLHSYDAAGNNLIIVLGADERENGWIGEALAEHAAVSGATKAKGLSLVNTDAMSVETRGKMYSQGGIFSITSQILVVDMLAGLMDPASITGIVALHAERIIATSTEAFILRIYRQKNKNGFLKAFSDNPEPLCTGFSPLATIMRNLFLRKPSIYPRFHVTINESLEGKRKAEVIEFTVDMSESMTTIQNAVLGCIQMSISELKKGNTGLDMEEWTPESALQKNFDTIVRRQLDPIWHRLSFRTKRVAQDLTLLRNILHNLLTLDAVKFLQYLDTVHAAAKAPSNSRFGVDTTWLLLPEAEQMFSTAKRRVYTGKITTDATGRAVEDMSVLRPVLEELPKWKILAEILDEIEREVYFHPHIQDDSNGTILIMCGDNATCQQLREFLRTMHLEAQNAEGTNEEDDEEDEWPSRNSGPSGAFMMRQRLRNYVNWRVGFSKVRDSLFSENQKAPDESKDGRNSPATRGRGPPNKRRRVRASSSVASGLSRNGTFHTAGDRDGHIASLLADLQPSDMDGAQAGEIGADPLNDMDDYYELYDMNDLLLIHPYDGDMNEHLLEEVKPRYVIMYEPDVTFVRQLEVYRSSHFDRKVRVYFMYYGGSVEEQRFLTVMRREKDAFTKLIKERASMAITLDTAHIATAEESFLRTINTRIAGGGRVAATQVPPRVVVDLREFRSSLPSLLHGRSVQVVPCLLTVGDYVLTPDICIERKSVSDLISSLNSGRLYNQAETMLQHYKSPMLLIEFSQNKSFTLEPFADLTNSASTAAREAMLSAPDLQGKLVMLTLAFPRLRIIWSSDPYQTAQIFEELKKLQEEPNPIKAVQTGLEDGDDADGQKVFNQTTLDMLREVPGITEKNMSRITLEVENMRDLANMDEQDIEPLVGKAVARQIRHFFDKNVADE
ncbi:DNA repair endonuclease XPF [Rhizodiscina lignyota]|uniref:DNA repair endonuclease XPF n=1 Tax=Rhizodiscina lignyota TaxID=1504668 RepID=A0A9P4IC91_9PEZI|nr:DNA repair endonuclease XPF [Rhizodiscina lignyota]